jgi:hypothetical protein
MRDYDQVVNPTSVSRVHLFRRIGCGIWKIGNIVRLKSFFQGPQLQYSVTAVDQASKLQPLASTNERVSSGTAFPFALTLVELLCGAKKRAEVCAPMMFSPGTPF